MDEASGYPRMWMDSNGNMESFKITEAGVNKKDEPIYQIDYDNSTIVFYVDGVKYQDKKSYDEAVINSVMNMVQNHEF